MTSKSLLKAVFSREETERPPVIPYVCSFAARLRGVSTRNMLNDPTTLANSLQDAVRLFDYDGITSVFDPTLEAEACGCEVTWPEDGPPHIASHPLGEGLPVEGLDAPEFENRGRIAVVMEATRRIKVVLGDEKMVIGVLSGPITLLQALSGKNLSEFGEEGTAELEGILRAVETVATRMVQLYGEIQVDAVMVVEESLSPRDAHDLDRVLPVYHSLWNIAGFYGAGSILLCGESTHELERSLQDIAADCVVLGRGSSLSRSRNIALENNLCFGGGIPTRDLFGPPEEVKKVVRESMEEGGRRGFLLCTDWEVPYDAPVEGLHAVMEAARK